MGEGIRFKWVDCARGNSFSFIIRDFDLIVNERFLLLQRKLLCRCSLSWLAAWQLFKTTPENGSFLTFIDPVDWVSFKVVYFFFCYGQIRRTEASCGHI